MFSAGRAAAHAFVMAALLALALLTPVHAEGARDSAAPAHAGGTAVLSQFPVEVVPQTGNSGWVWSTAFSPDGRFILAGGMNHNLKLWDIATGKQLRSFSAHDDVLSVAFSPNGRFAISGNSDNTLKLWEVATGKEVRSFSGHTSAVMSVAFSPDGRLVLSGSRDSTAKLWDAKTGKLIFNLIGHQGYIQAVAFSPDGRLALTGAGGDGPLRLWDLTTGKEVRSFIGQPGGVRSLAFSPDGRLAVSAGADKMLRLWDVATGNELRSFYGHAEIIWSVAFSPNGRFALSGGCDERDANKKWLCINSPMKLWDVATGKELRNFRGHTGDIHSVVFSPDGRLAISGSHDNSLKLWEVATGRELRSFSEKAVGASAGAFSPDGRFALTNYNTTLKLWELATGKELRSFNGHSNSVFSIAFSLDGRFALSGSQDKTLKLWEVATGKELRSFSGHTEAVHSVAFSPDGRFALSGSSDKTLKLWEVATGKELRSFSGHSASVFSVAFSPDGRFALSGSGGFESSSLDNTVRLWEVATGKELRTFSGHTRGIDAVAFSPDGHFALSGSHDGTLRLWEVATGKELRSLTGHVGAIFSVAFSPNGRFALSGGWDNTLKLWDVATGKELRSFTGHTSAVWSVAFSLDGRFALSCSGDDTTRIWDVMKGQEVARTIAASDGERLTITPSGFFTAPSRDTDMLAIVRGMEVTTIGQVHQSLFNPDLVRQAMAGDPDGEVSHAAEVINLEKVLDSGPAPQVEISSQSSGRTSQSDLVTVTARIEDRGKGIGRIEWRVNGVTIGVTNAPAGAGPVYEVRQEVALDLGDNEIEVVAYNARNLLASTPARTTIAYINLEDSVEPKLHILAIGIDAYTGVPKLNLAVADARAFVAEMEKAGAGLYSGVRVRTVLDTEATAAGLGRAVEDFAAGIAPRDTFVLFAAAHGFSQGGRFYLVPQDYPGGIEAQTLAAHAIGQERLQDWIANRIKAKKAIILLDTCESGALTQGYSRSRMDRPASEAAIGRLHEATGRPVLTAAAEGQDATELAKLGHGIFTYALLDALHHARTDESGAIRVSDLAAYVQDRVPQLVAGGEGRSAIPRGAAGGGQSAHFGTTGSDFALVKRLP